MARRRDERGIAFPSPLVMLSIIAIAMAGIAFVATKDRPAEERRVETVSRTQEPTVAETPVEPVPEVTPTVEPEPVIERGKVYVEVYNNSGIRGLAATTAAKVSGAGWQVVGSDNWYGTVPGTTVYFPKRLKAEAKLLALDLGVQRVQPAVSPMKLDRLTVILTG
jgi:LytR cell envelope-related transcriptional attenuator